MRTTSFLPGLCFAAASLTAQTPIELPTTANASAELPNYTLLPLMQPNARVQLFYDAAETGTVPFVTDELSLRFDGPLPQVGAPGPFQINRLRIRIGTTAVPAPGADFTANLTQPLTQVFDGPVTYSPDPGMASPHPWGAPNGSLTFAFTTPVPIAVAAGQWLVVELVMEGNNISSFGFAHAMLDGITTSGGFANGSAAAYGQGCSSGTATATATTAGLYGPGGAHFLRGSNLGANAFVLGVFGLSNTTAFVPLPFTLPGTSCSLLASPDVTLGAFADANGALTGNDLVLALPASPALSNMVVYEQLAALVPTANPWGIVFSNGVAVTLGTWTAPGRGTFLIAHDSDANAAYANSVRSFGMALRLHTL